MNSLNHGSQWRFPESRLAISRLTKRARRGFTLMEILLVVIIIGILAATIAPRLTGQTDKARRARAQAELETLQTGLKMFEMNTGRFPSGDEGLDALINPPGDMSEEEWGGPYLEEDVVPKDPWGNDYQYVYPGEKSRDFDLWSGGSKEGTEDDITNWSDKQEE